jgi:hypothetical protein
VPFTQTGVLALKVDVGAVLTTTFCDVKALVHPFCVTDKVTDFVPEELQLTECGPAPVAVAGFAPNPKFHE